MTNPTALQTGRQAVGSGPASSRPAGRREKRPLPVRIVGAVALMLMMALVGGSLLTSLRGGGEIPTYEVQSGPFTHEIQVEGLLQAEQATVLTVPMIERAGGMKLAWTAPDGSRVEAGDLVVRFDATDLEKELFDGESERDKSLSERSRAQVEQTTGLANLDRDARMAQLQLEHAQSYQTTDEELFSRMQIIESEIDQELATHRVEHVNGVRTIREQLGDVELDLLDLDRQRAELAIERAQAGLDALEVRAPHDGIFVLSRQYGWTPQVGEMVYPGFPLGEIPRLDSMKAVVYVLEADAGGVRPGIPARVILEAHPTEQYEARVRQVAKVATRRTRYSPLQYFEVEIELPTTDPEKMKPGQRVRATLVLQDLAEALSVPREAVFENNAGDRIVYRWRNGDYQPVKVTLGAAALGRVVVEQGLSAGDVVAMIDPNHAPRPAGQEPADSAPSPGGPGTGR